MDSKSKDMYRALSARGVYYSQLLYAITSRVRRPGLEYIAAQSFGLGRLIALVVVEEWAEEEE